MTTNELKAMIEKLENMEQFMEDLRNAVEDEEVEAVLKNYGLEISLEDLESIRMPEGELDEDSLDAVAGGKCKCKGPLKRLITRFCEWVFGIECIEC